MSKLLDLELISPEGIIFKNQVQNLSAKTEEGEIGILYDHAELRAKLDNSPVSFTLADGSKDVFAVLGGIIELSQNKITILTSFAEKGSDIDEAQAKKASERARTEYQTLDPEARKQDSQFILAEANLQRQLLRLKTARLAKSI